MYSATWKKSVTMLALASSLLLGACASQEAVEHAQSTADQALSLAQQANQKADKAEADAAAANAKADRMFQQGLKK